MLNYLSDRQMEAVEKLTGAGRGIVWWKIGEGKTRIALALYQAYRGAYARVKEKLLVVCSPQAIRQWEDEIAISPYKIDVEFLSYGLLSQIYGDRVAYQIQIREDIALVVLDELWLYKNVKSIRSKNVTIIANKHPTIGLSGSLITNRNIEDLYGQACAVGIGKRLANSLTNFRTQFCLAIEEYGGLQFYPKRKAIETIQSRLARHIDIYFPHSLREVRTTILRVKATSEQLEYFTALKEDYYVNFLNGAKIEIKNAAVLISKLQQVSDGAVLNGQKVPVHIPNNKICRLRQLLAEYADAGQRVVVWFAFKASLDLAFAECDAKTARLSSDHKFDSEGWRKGRYTAAFCTIGSGASLNDFAHCEFSIIYSTPFNHLAVQQALGRTNRTSSTHAVCNYQWLSTEGGIDEYVYDLLRITDSIEKKAIIDSATALKKYFEKHGN